ncbi:hypothetical protein [Streptomyces swartbergensis]|uniref:Uncharacterized protein n=1 Tax=Streptomyces swartbergensis TaxID=487165 RepID=A0A243S5J1_9ACTN|nr:hypothetical protein [Streptomyces swartbergensis]OUD02577.1 hypothetical protein CA983_14220 [Streptomyces swartbergensis]
MATVGYAQLPIPGGGDAPVGPGALAEFGLAVDPHLVQHVVDQAERDSQYAAAPLHTLVSAENGSLWLKTSATSNTWATIYAPLQPWRPITLAAGFAAGQTSPEVRIDRGQVFLRGRVEKSDETTIGLSGVKLGTVPDDCIPEQLSSWAGGQSIAGDPSTAVGRMECFSADQDSNALGGRGSLVWYSQDGTGTSWVDISGSYWLD